MLTENCAKLEIKSGAVIPYFLKCVLSTSIVQRQIQSHFIQTTIPKLGLERIANLKIPPIPSIPIQEQIINLEKHALKQRADKEAEAQSLLASIDGYVLAQLGIESFDAEDNSLQRRMFYTTANKTTGQRFDTFFHFPFVDKLESQVRQHHPRRLGEFILFMSGGATPLKDGGDLYYTEDASEGVPFLRVQNIQPDGLSLDDVVFINRKTHETSLKRSQVVGGDLLVTITGRIASACVAPKDFEGNINQHSVLIRTGDVETNRYLALYLNSFLGQKLALRRTTGGTRPALDYRSLRSIPVAFPDEKIRDHLIGFVNSIYQQAKGLRAEGRAIVERAKQEVEAMILGEESSR